MATFNYFPFVKLKNKNTMSLDRMQSFVLSLSLLLQCFKILQNKLQDGADFNQYDLFLQ